MDRIALQHWDGIPVFRDDRLSLNVVVRDYDEIRMSDATWKQLVVNPDMRACAMKAVENPGAHSIPALRRIPNHHVGEMFRKSQTLLNKAANGMGSEAMENSLRREIADIRALLDETELALDTCGLVRKASSPFRTADDDIEVVGSF